MGRYTITLQVYTHDEARLIEDMKKEWLAKGNDLSYWDQTAVGFGEVGCALGGAIESKHQDAVIENMDIKEGW